MNQGKHSAFLLELAIGRDGLACGARVVLSLGLLLGPLMEASAQQAGSTEGAPAAGESFEPPSYVVYRANNPVTVDGRLDESDWAVAPWTEYFVDISAPGRPAPRYRTRAKMLWDAEKFYVAAELEEPDVWATFTRRDSPIYNDNAFEVFIDPDGDSHNYYEFEINALGTVWDLLLVRPFRDGGPSLSAWDIRGLESEVVVDGTVNDPSDTDRGWTVELAFPWFVLREAAPGRRPPRGGEQWRLNFARSEWQLDEIGGGYHKRPDTEADWWVWSSQGAVDMHRPERFGYVQFSDHPAAAATEAFRVEPNERIKRALRALYHAQRGYQQEHGRYADDFTALEAGEIAAEIDARLKTTATGYEMVAPGAGETTVHIRHDGRIWTIQPTQ